jgi:AraC family transcriptional regulator, exoenzyme S synthesis regulatory protein ExsA
VAIFNGSKAHKELPADASAFPMLNALESIRANPIARKLDIGELLFAQFTCPGKIGIWTQTDHLLHVLSGTFVWKTATDSWTVDAGGAVYVKKGAYVLPETFEDEHCVQVYFVPDEFIRETVIELGQSLPALQPATTRDLVMRVNNDIGLSAFFSAMTVYFAGDEDPPSALLKLKLKELLTSVLIGKSNPTLSAYLRFVAASGSPLIAPIMESNFHHNLPLPAFAKMCHRSLSSFKRDFAKLFGVPPGKWLLSKRLERAASLLHNTDLRVTEIVFDCGFADSSHFSRAFKEKFGRSPSTYRQSARGKASAAGVNR